MRAWASTEALKVARAAAAGEVGEAASAVWFGSSSWQRVWQAVCEARKAAQLWRQALRKPSPPRLVESVLRVHSSWEKLAARKVSRHEWTSWSKWRRAEAWCWVAQPGRSRPASQTRRSKVT